ncbi:proteasome-associated ATPase-like [Heracleum sosnowskyi]|uniref:Proteasome-associated ATPase-like n=1 Tax=Heracleum sosnowskyi TaxID=360622 RepID=A0AAD8HE91_9APIA|nr:proteasome-associated ATPase-like [Heracleum sosnowskyi]
MASMRNLSRTIRACRTASLRKTLPVLTTSSPLPQFRLYHGSCDNHMKTCASKLHLPTPNLETTGLYAIPAVLAGLLGGSLLEIAHAEANEADSKMPTPPESAPSYKDLEEIAKKERIRLEELIKSKGLRVGFYPRFTVGHKGQKVTIKFQVPPTCEIPHLISNLVSQLGVKVDTSATGSDMTVRAWDSGVAWQLTLTRPSMQKEPAGTVSGSSKAQEEDLCILMFRSLISSDKAEIEFMKSGSFSQEELDAFVSLLQMAGQNKTLEQRPRGSPGQMPTKGNSITNLEAMGIKIYGLNEPNTGDSKSKISWENIAGYSQQKREIEDTILLAIQSPEVYDDIARGTRCKFETNRPRAVLFEGPPGTGKTSCARVIANQAGVPLLYVPLEVVMSKYYGESERLLGKVFSLANEIPNGAIIFLDEIDSIATARDNETHEATRRVLSVLLRQIDGFEQDKRVVVIAATNRKQDLDPALISRFDSMIMFGLPDQPTRQEIAAQYAKHLTKSELAEFATATVDMSGRDIRDVCQQAERHWASKIIRGQAPKEEEGTSLPPLQEYTKSAASRHKALVGAACRNQFANGFSKKPEYDI